MFVLTVSELAPLSSLSLLQTHIDSISAPHEDSACIFRKDLIQFPCHTMSCDRFDICFWKGRLREETISLNIFAIKSSGMLKKQLMLVCLRMLLEKNTLPQVQKAST